MTGRIQKWRIYLGELRNGAKTKAGPLEDKQLMLMLMRESFW
jgi:hypothetical protein